jgi:aminoglycoside phosphotransferase (APT) family kinase protein
VSLVSPKSVATVQAHIGAPDRAAEARSVKFSPMIARLRCLLHDQFPQWAGLQLQPVESFGTEHSIFRIGDRLVGRFPLLPAAETATAVEARWLPELTPLLPCRVPVVVALGQPALSYPFTWAVSEWLDGEDGWAAAYDELSLARDLAAFLRALDRIDRAAVTRSWEESLGMGEWDRTGVWLHGDPLPGNLLFAGGRLTGVIDFGGPKAGDPACDLQPAWNMFSGASRTLFREAMEVDEATWLRGRGWTLYQTVTGLEYYWETNPRMIRQASHALSAVLSGS